VALEGVEDNRGQIHRRTRSSVTKITQGIRATLARRRFEQVRREGIVAMGVGSYGLPAIKVWRNRQGRALGGRVTIGAYVSIGDGVEIFTGGNHRTDWVTTYPVRTMLNLPGADDDGHPASRGDVRVGNDVWIGAGAVIMSGVTIGDGAVIGARAVVARDVRPYAVVVGNPAREVRRRFSDSQVDALTRISWWNWPPEAVRDRAEALCSPDIDGFIRAFDGT
jgi:acetyltransferase-like isoleucine patch superfamily enzyme